MDNQSDSSIQSTKVKVAKTAIVTISSLFVLKVAAAAATGSIGILADALHSLLDLSAALIGYVAVRVSGKPPDREHHFGHGRAEDIAGASIATIIFIAAGIIAYQAIQRLAEGTAVQMVEAGIIATGVAIAINVAVSRYVLRIAKAADSVALEATGRDLMADVMSSVAVFIGLILVRITGQPVLDPVVALIVVALIARTAHGTLRKAIRNLMDTKLPEKEERKIRQLLGQHEEIANYHSLRTRKAGSQRHVVAHIVVSRDHTVEEGHRIAEEVEDQIRALYRGTTVTVHVEPCTPECTECPAPCREHQEHHNARRGTQPSS